MAAKGSIEMDIDTKKLDFERIHSLLNTVHLCAGVGPKLTSIGNAAMAELTKINDAIKVAAREAEEERRARAIPSAPAENDPSMPEPDEDVKRNIKPTEDTMVKPSAYPADSRTATIADRRV